MQLTKKRSLEANYRICTRCIYDTSVPAISFDDQGVCNYCKMVDTLKLEHHTGTKQGEKDLTDIVQQIKDQGKGKKYDCVIGVSGGTDSSYLMYWAIQKGLRPLAVHYDNTFNSNIATSNIEKVTSKLNIDLYTYVVNNEEIEDIYRAFFYANVPELDASTDLALAEVLYRAASKYNVKFILEGHSFIEEGVTPLGKNYFDGKYIRSIHKLYGKTKMRTYPLMTFSRFMKWILLKRIKKIRPYWYVEYSKQKAKDLLKKEFGWEDYGGHHLENRLNAFSHSVYFPQKFNIDYRNNTLSAQVRNGKKNREVALKEYYEDLPYIEEGLIKNIKARMNFTDEEYEKILTAKPRYWYEFPTYKKRFEKLRPLFSILQKANLVPKSFYLKYCFPVKNND